MSCCLLASAALCGVAAGAGAQPVHPALRLLARAGMAESPPVHVSPYMVNLVALRDLEAAGRVEGVGEYLEWYLSRLNYPDRHGLTGTIYDMEIDAAGRERLLFTYDSVDGYAATFLELVNAYAAFTNDYALVARHAGAIRDVGYTLALLQDRDGLTFADPTRRAKYLMDNCEVQRGLRAMIELSQRFGWDPGYYAAVAAANLRGIETVLYDAGTGRFAWAVDAKVVHVSNWDRFYPDAFAQLFPLLAEVGFLGPQAREALWGRFVAEHGVTAAHAPPEQRAVFDRVYSRMETP